MIFIFDYSLKVAETENVYWQNPSTYLLLPIIESDRF